MVTLAWDANSEPDLAGYIMHYGTSSRDYLDGVDVGNTTGCTISGLEPGQVWIIDDMNSGYGISSRLYKKVILNIHDRGGRVFVTSNKPYEEYL